jgi:hypothetical protein
MMLGAMNSDVRGHSQLSSSPAGGSIPDTDKTPTARDALKNDELIHEASAIVGRLAPSALAHANPPAG